MQPHASSRKLFLGKIWARLGQNFGLRAEVEPQNIGLETSSSATQSDL